MGDPCAGGVECVDSCNEIDNTCLATAGTPCSDDGNVCTTEQCNATGACVTTDNTLPCSDSLFCSGIETCAAGACVSSGDPCAGGAECGDICDEVGNTCDQPITTPCGDDGNVCTTDICNGLGACIHPDNTGRDGVLKKANTRSSLRKSKKLSTPTDYWSASLENCSRKLHVKKALQAKTFSSILKQDLTTLFFGLVLQ